MGIILICSQNTTNNYTYGLWISYNKGHFDMNIFSMRSVGSETPRTESQLSLLVWEFHLILTINTISGFYYILKCKLKPPSPIPILFPSELKQILFQCLVNITFEKAKYEKDGGLPVMLFF